MELIRNSRPWKAIVRYFCTKVITMPTRNRLFRSIVLLSVLLSPASISRAEPKEEIAANKNVIKSMRAKLEHAKLALEGITRADYEKIEQAADKMAAMTEADFWHVMNTPKYVNLSVDFHKAVDSLRDAAKMKDLDSATLRFMKVTTSCVECHRHVRNVRVVRAAEPPAYPIAIALSK